VEPGGYAWWYLDALSDDGSSAITIISFVGSVFSPWYAAARRHGAPSPADHCALNVAVYGRRSLAWAMTERTSLTTTRSAMALHLGRSTVAWEGDTLVVQIDERTAPLGRPLRGVVRLQPERDPGEVRELDGGGRHRWWPVAPRARAEVRLEQPWLRFDGDAYHDANEGDEPLEAAFSEWTWSRTTLPSGTAVLYDVRERGAQQATSWGRLFRSDGASAPLEAPAPVRLPGTLWRIHRESRAALPGGTRLVRTLEDTPFYARSMVEATLAGERGRGVHEALDLRRFASPVVQRMLAFRMRREA
jgi:carotenoid 1,2-hydratase